MSDTDRISFSHYTLFRKTVLGEATGTLAFITCLGFAGRIPFVDGKLANGVELKTLQHFFSQPIQRVHWESLASGRHESSDQVITEQLASVLEKSVVWTEAYAQQLQAMLSKLPAVEVENLSVHFDDYHFEICASLLHRQSLANASFAPAAFFSGVSNYETLQVRLKVALLAYVCGLMKARQPASVNRRQSGGEVHSVVSRIFQRIKRIGTS